MLFQSRLILALCSLLTMATLLCPSIAQACKDMKYPSAFPVEELEYYAHVYVVRVTRVTDDESVPPNRYARPFSFEGEVVHSFKGASKAGEMIAGATTSGQEAHARCPIRLEAGKVYLLMLDGSQSPYALPRYGSLYVSSERPEFSRYVADLLNGKANE